MKSVIILLLFVTACSNEISAITVPIPDDIIDRHKYEGLLHAKSIPFSLIEEKAYIFEGRYQKKATVLLRQVRAESRNRKGATIDTKCQLENLTQQLRDLGVPFVLEREAETVRVMVTAVDYEKHNYLGQLSLAHSVCRA